MKLKISLSGSQGFAEKSASAVSYVDWQSKVNKHRDFDRIDKLDDNKMAAYDKAGKVMDTFIIDVRKEPQSTDTLDSQQVTTPADKIKNDLRVGGVDLEKGA